MINAMPYTIEFYAITEILRALRLADACHLLEYRCTNDVTAWLSMPEVCLEKTIESCLKVELSKVFRRRENS